MKTIQEFVSGHTELGTGYRYFVPTFINDEWIWSDSAICKLLEKADDFWAFSKAGRQLADLHLNQETIEPYNKCVITYQPYEQISYIVQKMKFGGSAKAKDKTQIIFNNLITINEIPLKAYDYIVNGKSAIEWIMERYAITTDKKSGITNDANDWCKEVGDEKYIFNLLLRIINLSLQSVEIIENLPEFNV